MENSSRSASHVAPRGGDAAHHRQQQQQQQQRQLLTFSVT